MEAAEDGKIISAAHLRGVRSTEMYKEIGFK